MSKHNQSNVARNIVSAPMTGGQGDTMPKQSIGMTDLIGAYAKIEPLADDLRRQLAEIETKEREIAQAIYKLHGNAPFTSPRLNGGRECRAIKREVTEKDPVTLQKKIVGYSYYLKKSGSIEVSSFE